MCTFKVYDYLNQINCLFLLSNHRNCMIGSFAVAHKFAGEQTGRQNIMDVVSRISTKWHKMGF